MYHGSVEWEKIEPLDGRTKWEVTGACLIGAPENPDLKKGLFIIIGTAYLASVMVKMQSMHKLLNENS